MVVRTVGATAALILGLSLLRTSGAPWLGRLFGALLCLGVVVYLPCSADWSACSRPILLPAAMLASGIPAFFWGWARSIMDDGFRLTWPPLLAGGILLCMPLFTGPLCPVEYLGWSVIAHSIFGIAFVIAGLLGVLRTWREDLIEARRRLRALVLAVVGAYSIVIMCVELYFHDRAAPQALQLLNAVSLTLLLLGLCLTLLAASQSMLAAFGWSDGSVAVRDSAPIDDKIGLTPASIVPAQVVTRSPEQGLVDRLQSLMTEKGWYRNAEVSIASLATTLGVQEKRLRELINRRLGHKNFPSFVNAYRLEEVRTRLADARNDHLPILTLALDSGFGSIVAFNRAFKERFAVTPTEYRNRRRAPPDQENVQ